MIPMKNTTILLIIILLISSSIAQLPMAGSDNFIQDEEKNVSELKSAPGKINILYSLILPGAGQWAMGHKSRAKIFMGTEFVLWAGFLGSHAYSNTIQQNYHSYATVHAGVYSAQKDEQYWIDIGSSNNIFEFNEDQLRNRNLKGVYTENSLNYWQWDSDNNQDIYNDMRVQEHNWEQRATFIVGAFVLNRIVSSVDVIRLIRKEKKEIDNQMSSLSFRYKSEKYGSGFFNLNLMVNW
jgi:hypothetical protein